MCNSSKVKVAMLLVALQLLVALAICEAHDDNILSREASSSNYAEEDLGDGLKVLSTFRPELCEHNAKTGDVIHYHYVGRLGDSGTIFGRSFDYNSPYIVSLGHGRIIAGMDRGLMNMCLWERRKITIPPHLGYGQRGVGQTIPPNSTLVFYTRLIKIERNGLSLGEDQQIEDLWNSGLDSYSDQKWEQTIDMIEEAVRLFNQYENQTFSCLKMCKDDGSILQVTPSDEDIVQNYAGNDPFVRQFLVYAARGRCVRDCKARNLPPKLRNPNSELIKDFRKRIPYSYLHYAYYQRGNVLEGARACFTYHHYNPTDRLAADSLPFYRNYLELGETEVVSREPVVAPHQAAFLAGKQSYDKEHWLEAADHFEQALILYKEALGNCHLLCEDGIDANLTQPNMNSQKKSLYEEYGLKAETMEYYQLLVAIVKKVLSCRIDCHDRMAVINGDQYPKYLSEHFNYLQYSYYKLGHLRKAASAVATFLAREPSDNLMASNVRYYMSELKLLPEEFVPRQEFVEIQHKLETETRLLHFAEHGRVKKREGLRGDATVTGVPPRHQEL